MRLIKSILMMIPVLGVMVNCKTSQEKVGVTASEVKGVTGSEVAVDAVIKIDKSQVLREIPRSFLGLSQEWPHVGDFTMPKVKAVILELASYDTGPFNLRIGGASADDWNYVLGEATWKHLRELQKEWRELYS